MRTRIRGLRPAALVEAAEGVSDRALALAVAALVAVTAAALALAGGGLRGESGEEPGRSFLARVVPERVDRRAEIDRLVAAEVRRLPLQRKAAQVVLAGFNGRRPRALARRLRREDLGGLVVRRENYGGPRRLARLLSTARGAALRARHRPPLVLVRQTGGRLSALRGLPPRRPPGRLRSVREAERVVGDSARRLERLGVHGVLGPGIDVSPEEGGILRLRAFSDDPELVADYAAATVRAYRSAGLLAAPEHFPGLGAAVRDPNIGPAAVGLSLSGLRERDLRPFRAAIEAGAPAVVIGNGAYAPDDFVIPATLSRAISTDLLRGELRFRGLAIADDLHAGAVAAVERPPAAAITALAAGADMLMMSGPERDQRAAQGAIVAAVRAGELSRERLDQAVSRVLATKEELGLRR